MPTPKKLLCVSTTAGYRHEAIEPAEQLLAQLAARDGRFTLDWVRQPADGDLESALQKLAPANLSNYDGVIFNSTTGDLPIPDRAGFLDWIGSGKAFIGFHAAADTFHGWPAYIEMLGGEFAHHGAQVAGEVQVLDANHRATRGLGASWKIAREEWYQFKNLNPDKHELLALERSPEDGAPGHFPVAWTRNYNKGRVFYSGLAHRDDLWNGDADLPGRENSVEVSAQFAAHVLGGITWALELA